MWLRIVRSVEEWDDAQKLSVRNERVGPGGVSHAPRKQSRLIV